MNNYNMQQALQSIMIAKRQGKNPQQMIQGMLQNNPQMQQTLTQLKNMAQGRSPKEFIMQLARQNGADETTLNMINEILN